MIVIRLMQTILIIAHCCFRFVLETAEEAAEWRVVMETAIAEALGDDTVVSE